MEKNSAVITGVGPVSAIGTGRNEFWEALTAGRHGFRPITLCDASRSPSKIAAEIPDFRLDRFVTDGDIMARRTPRSTMMIRGAPHARSTKEGTGTSSLPAGRGIPETAHTLVTAPRPACIEDAQYAGRRACGE